MPYAVLEKEIERLDETQRNAVVLFVRFLLSQKAGAANSIGLGEKPRKYDFSDLIGKVKFEEDPVAYQRRTQRHRKRRRRMRENASCWRGVCNCLGERYTEGAKPCLLVKS